MQVESGGYSGVSNVDLVPPQQDDKMQTFWTAETLKYLYLLFSPPGEFDFTKWVFNTEAHPFLISNTSSQGPQSFFAGN